MRLLELLGIMPKDQREAIRLTETECWRLDYTDDGPLFYRALSILTRPDAILYMEDISDAPVVELLRQREIAAPTPIALGTILPRPRCFHMPATPTNLDELAAVIHAHGVVLPAIHTHLYAGRQVLLEWYDAFTDDPIYISASYAEEQVRKFANALRTHYTWAAHPA